MYCLLTVFSAKGFVLKVHDFWGCIIVNLIMQ